MPVAILAGEAGFPNIDNERDDECDNEWIS